MALTNAEIQQVLDAIAALGKKVADLPTASELVGNELAEVSQGGVSKKTALDSILALADIPQGLRPLNNLAAVAAPTVTDDSDSGYSVGSLWGFGDNLYKCTDASVGAAVWVVYSKSSSKTDFVPTVSSLVGGTFTVTNFLITEVGGVVEFSFAGRFDLAAATTSGGCKIDLPPAFQPTANWSSQTDVNVVLFRTNAIFTSNCSIYADDSGTKLLQITINDTTAEASVRFSAIGRYKIA